MSIIPVQIVECASQTAVDAALHTDLKPADLLDAEAEWGPIRLKAAADRLRTKAPTDDLPQHSHWDWARKASALQYLANTVFGIQKDGKWQGLAMTTTVGHLASLQPDAGKPLVYIKYIESAPWNLRAFTKTPVYGAIGTRLLEAAARQSLDENFHGRLGLHSLPNPKTEGFYRRSGMVRVGIDANVEGLPYYEFTQAAAQGFLKGGQA